MTLKKLDRGIFVDDYKIDQIRNLDAIIFDCDGVLIDVTNSYDLTIKKCVDYITNKIALINELNLVSTKIIGGFKDTGGFNDEVDVTYALVLSIVAAKKLNKPFSKFIIEVIKNSDQTGITSVEKFLNSLKVDLSDIKQKLVYPGKRSESLLSSIFDEMFYGTELYTQLYKRKPQFFNGTGLIENDIVLVTHDLLGKLHKRFKNNISMVTGRGLVSASYSLKKLFDGFDLKNSRFLEDEPREMAKPNPKSLISSIKGMGASCSVFVGDSTEDYLMARKTNETGNTTLFCGVYGTSEDPATKLALFEDKGADIIVESINLLPKTLNLVGV